MKTVAKSFFATELAGQVECPSVKGDRYMNSGSLIKIYSSFKPCQDISMYNARLLWQVV